MAKRSFVKQNICTLECRMFAYGLSYCITKKVENCCNNMFLTLEVCGQRSILSMHPPIDNFQEAEFFGKNLVYWWVTSYTSDIFSRADVRDMHLATPFRKKRCVIIHQASLTVSGISLYRKYETLRKYIATKLGQSSKSSLISVEVSLILQNSAIHVERVTRALNAIRGIFIILF